MALTLGLFLAIAVAVQQHRSPMETGDRFQTGQEDLVAGGGASSSEDPAERLRVEWEKAEARYGLYRPSPGEARIAVHRQTTKRLDISPVAWEYIPVQHNMLPGEILSDIDIHDNWERVSWWLWRIHSSSRMSSQSVLAVTNYVLVPEDEFLAADMRPHGLVEFVLGDDRVVFPTLFPQWINLSILRTFLEPMIARSQFGVAVHGFYNGRVLGHRLIRSENGFFIQVHFLAAPFLLGEMHRSVPLHAATFHLVTDYPGANDVSSSVVYVAGGYTLISSRVFERIAVHSKYTARWISPKDCYTGFLTWKPSILTLLRSTGHSAHWHLVLTVPRPTLFWRCLKRSARTRLLWLSLTFHLMWTLGLSLSRRFSPRAGSWRRLALI